MEDEEGNLTGQGNSQSRPNNTTIRSVERTAKQVTHSDPREE